MILKVKHDGLQLLNYLNNIMKWTIIQLRLKLERILKFCCKDGQTDDDYNMCYEKYKVKMRLFKMDLGEHIHKLNLLCAANLSNDELCITMREVNTKYSNDKCKPKSLKVHLFLIIKLKVHNQ